MIEIPFLSVAQETLAALLGEITTRDGTDYGEHELNQEKKVEQLLAKLQSGQAVLCFDEANESCAVLGKLQWAELQAAEARGQGTNFDFNDDRYEPVGHQHDE